MGLDVVPPAAQLEVVEVGGAAPRPVLDVMGVAPSGGCTAAGDDASPVTRGERAPLRRRHHGCAPAEVQHQRSSPHDHTPDARVAREAFERGLTDRPDSQQLATDRLEVGR